jgi:UDP-N-acetylglucosamine diphosphorylase/glucosamine-1-phosphate N-acetyltransferase
MKICVYEDAGVGNLWPLTLTRPAFDLRCGTGTLLERHKRYFAGAEIGVQVRPELVSLARWMHADLPVNDPDWLRSRGEVVFVNARWLAPTDPPPAGTWCGSDVAGDQVAWTVLHAADIASSTPWSSPRSYTEDGRCARPAGGLMLDYPWDIVEQNGQAIRGDFSHWSKRESAALPAGVTIVGPSDQVFVDPSARVEALAVLDATHGPIVVDAGAVVQALGRLEGPCYVGPECQVLGAKVRGGTTLGRGCRVGGEVEASVLHGFVNKYHDGFVGHSYVGGWVNLGAGTQVSDLRNDYHPISVFLGGKKVETGLVKVGAYLGDYTRTSVGALLNAGTVVGPFGQLLANGGLLPRSVPPFCQLEHGHVQERSDIRLMFEAAATGVGRRDREWTDIHAEFFYQLYVQTEAERRRAIRESEQRRMRRVV